MIQYHNKKEKIYIIDYNKCMDETNFKEQIKFKLDLKNIFKNFKVDLNGFSNGIQKAKKFDEIVNFFNS